MLRQKKRIELQLRSDCEQRLVDSGSRLHAGEFKVRVHQHRIFARWIPASNFDSPPVFHGRVERQPDRLAVSGTVRETASRALFPVTCVVLVVAGIICLVVGFTAGSDANGGRTIPLIVGFVLTPLFGIIGYFALHHRHKLFDQQSAELQTWLDSYLRTGAANRTGSGRGL